jgi:hypothetical protein
MAFNCTNVFHAMIRSVRVKFLQAYLLSGGSGGRLARGDATLDFIFIDETPRMDDGSNVVTNAGDRT